MVSQCTRIEVYAKIVHKQTQIRNEKEDYGDEKCGACVKCESLQCLPLQIAALS